MSEKSEKLEQKVDKLIERIDKETNPIKRHILSIRIKGLQQKINREIELQNLIEKKEVEKELLKQRKEDKKENAEDELVRLVALEETLSKYLSKSTRYDYQSEHFIFPANYVENEGGIDNIVQKLKNKPDERSKNAAHIIQLTNEAREELNKVREDIIKQQQVLAQIEQQYEGKIDKVNSAQKALILKDKLNIFSGIGNFFKNLGEEVKSFIGEMKENKIIKEQEKAERAEITSRYEEAMKKLKEEYDKEVEQAKVNQQKNMEDKNSDRAHTAAEEFRKGQVVTVEDDEEKDVAGNTEPETQPVQEEEAVPEQLESDGQEL